MTTVTPSDRAGAASAKRSASIPTQRSGQALRLLVLGTGEGAAAFRERAAEAGAELAQRFSVRVTHVVAEDGIGDEDARVVRARTAGLPVLGLTEGARLLEGGGDEGQASSEVAVGADAETGAGVDAEAAVEVVDAAGAVSVDDVGDGVLAAAEFGDGGGTEVWADAEADEASRHRVQLVRPRNEFVPESVEFPVEVGPADVFTGSALEAVLLFPPLAVSRAGADDADVETEGEAETESESEFRAAFAVGVDDRSSALMEIASVPCGCGDEGPGSDLDSCADTHVSLDADVDAGDEVELGAGAFGTGGLGSGASGSGGFEGGREGEGEVDVLEVGVLGDGVGVSGGVAVADGAGSRAASRTAASIAWALVPLVSLGLLTPVAMGYAAFRAKSRLLWVATAGYSLAMITAFTLSAAAPLRTGSHAAVGELLTACLVSSWLGGTVHSFLIRRRVFG